MATVHIESKKGDIANIVLMPGDPKRAEYVATKYLSDVKIVNLVRKMSAYTGTYKGKRITIFPSGMGIPSIGIYSYELYNEYNVDYIIRIGSMGSYVEELSLNDIVLVDNAISDSTYAYYMDGYNKKNIASNSELNNVIIKTSTEKKIPLKKAHIYSSDVFYEKEKDYLLKVKSYGVCGVEMETFGLFTNARILGKKAASLLTVSDLFYSSEKLSVSDRENNLDNMILLALESCLKL